MVTGFLNVLEVYQMPDEIPQILYRPYFLLFFSEAILISSGKEKKLFCFNLYNYGRDVLLLLLLVAAILF